VLFGAAAVPTSCIDLPSDRVWTSAHFRYHTRATDDDACRDILPLLEAHAEVVHDALGMGWDPGEVIDYYKFDGLADVSDNSGCGELACADGATVRSAAGFHPHELVHAYLWKVGFPPWLLIEGTATAVACEVPAYPRPTIGWRDAFEADRHSWELYGAGGWLVSRLLATRDPRLFVRLYGSLSNDADADTFAAVFQHIYGERLDDVWDETVAAEGGTVFCPWECSRPPISLDGTPTTLDAVCGQVLDAKTFSLDAGADIVWSGAGDITFDIRSCDRVESLGDWAGGYGADPSFTALVPVSAGTHFVHYFASAPGTEASLSGLMAEQPLITSDCATGPVVMIETASVQVYFPPSDSALSVRLSSNPARSMSWVPPLQKDPSEVAMCGACGSLPDSCAPLSSDASGVTIGAESVLTAQPGAGAFAIFRQP
jgi:hypothetical protein